MPTPTRSSAPAVWLEIAERELNARRPREAADAAANGLDIAQPRPLKQRLLEVRAQALAGLGDNDAAFDAHRQVLALATSNATLGEQLFRLAQVSRDLGKRDAAVQALKTALDQFPSGEHHRGCPALAGRTWRRQRDRSVRARSGALLGRRLPQRGHARSTSISRPTRLARTRPARGCTAPWPA